MTLKLSKSNLADSGDGLQSQQDQQSNFIRSSSIKKRSSFRQLTKLRPLTSSFTSGSLSSAAEDSEVKNRGEAAHLFMALKFDDDFECSKFYDFFRVLFTDSQNDDLFNPHYKPSSTSSSSSSSNSSSNKQSSLIKVIYKKITKNSISSPVAFKIINSLSSVDEEALNNNSNNANCLVLSPDTQSIHSSIDLGTTASMLTLKRNLI